MQPTARAAIATRPSSRVARNCAKPRPRSPRRLASGTCASSKLSGWVSEACQPSLSYAGSAVNPGVPDGHDDRRDLGLRPGGRAREARARGHRDARGDSEPELVMNCLAPLTTHSPSTSSALVRVAPASEPAPGSVRPKPASVVPATRSGSHCCLLLVGAVGQDRVDPEPDGGLEGDPHRLVDPADLLDRDAQAGEVAVLARAAVLLGGGEAHQPELAHLLHHVGREVVVAVPLGRVGRDLGLGEVADHTPELLVLARQLVRHGGHANPAG